MILDFLVDFIFPKFCVVCDKEGSFLCRKCKKNLPSALQVCPMCTRPSIYGLTHEYCRKKYDMDGLMAIFDYKNEAVKKLIETVKFGFNQELVAIVALSLQVSLSAVAISTVIGLPIGAVIAVARFPGRQMVIALLNGSDVTLKKLYREQGRIRLQPANPAMQPILASPDQVQVQGVVVGVLRRY